MIAAARTAGHELVPTLHASAQPSGTIEAETYRSLRDELIERISAALPVDAVVLDTHGAGVVDGIDDLEADLARAIRGVIGPDLALVTTLDLHGTITDAMNDQFDLMLGVYDYPHVDMYERGEEAIAAAAELVAGRLRPTTHVEFLPMLLPTSTTDAAPAGDIRRRCLDLTGEPGYVRGAFFHGFPYTDTPHAGASVVVTTNDDLDRARTIARSIAAEVWQRRDEFRTESLSPDIAVRRAAALIRSDDRRGPVVMNDTADNPGGGAPGDATHLLRALLEARIADEHTVCFGVVYDPDTAAQAVAAGPGVEIEVVLGGRHDELHGPPVTGRAYVKAVSDGRFVQTSPMLAGVPRRLGPMARLQIGRPAEATPGFGGIDVIVGSRRSQVFDAEVFALHGIDVSTYDLVVVKSSQHFRAWFAERSAAIVTADAPGLTTLRVEHFAHDRLDGPRWPIDPDVAWTPST